jgi:hypothetical protein
MFMTHLACDEGGFRTSRKKPASKSVARLIWFSFPDACVLNGTLPAAVARASGKMCFCIVIQPTGRNEDKAKPLLLSFTRFPMMESNFSFFILACDFELFAQCLRGWLKHGIFLWFTSPVSNALRCRRVPV